MMMATVIKRNLLAYCKKQTRSIFSFQRKRFDLGKCNIVKLGNVSPELFVPDHIEKPSYFYDYNKQPSPKNVEIKNANDIEQMRISCKLAAKILKMSKELIKPGITTDAIDKFVHNEIISADAYPSPLRYGGFPKSVCTSVNNVVCHGIPDDRALIDGDIIHVDITVYYRGFHGDCSYTFEVGNVDERGKLLIKTTEECLNMAIECCGPNKPMNVIGKCIERYANTNGLNVIPAFIGHGIGKYFHGPPEVWHFDNNYGGQMMPGMTFTIEPILTLGDREIEIQEDGWTALSIDNSRSASFEHTILITSNGVEVLTQI